MKRNRFTVEQIIRMLREAEVHLVQGKMYRPLQSLYGERGGPEMQEE